MGDNSIERLEAREPELDAEAQDVEPAQTGDRAPAPAVAEPEPATKIPGRGPAWAALILALTAGAGAGGLYWQQQALRGELAALHSAAAGVQPALEASRGEAQRGLAAESEARAALAARVEEAVAERRALQASVQEVADKLLKSPESWKAAEAEYLVRLAALRLAERDSATALRFLADADARASELASATPLRAALAQDMATLRTSPSVDLAGLNLRIEALLPRIAALPLPLPLAEAQAPVSAQARAEAELQSDWRKAWDRVWSTLKRDWIEVRHYQGTSPELELPELRQYLDQNLALALGQAQWAANRGDAAAFQGALGRADTWVRRYFRAEAPETTGFLAALAELKAMDVAPRLPGVEASLKAAEELRIGLAAAAERVGASSEAQPVEATPAETAPTEEPQP
ncbi:MAG: uroporphyrinogen-III C-methyltransferase [Gammaproteobacteria bacterium]|nr:uroporphyrinogen-III C-methyltransferase [Gammaproteobacteria bacterium]